MIKLQNLEGELSKIGGGFYEDSKYFYVLDRTEKRLDTLLVYGVLAFKNGLIGIQPEQKYDDYSIYTYDNERIEDKKYYFLKDIGSVLFGLRNDNYYILDEKGNETLVSGVDKIFDNSSDDRIMASNHGKIGFLNNKGKIIIPFKYDDAKDFGFINIFLLSILL